MNTERRLSGPVLAFSLMGLAIILLGGWYALKRQRAELTATSAKPAETAVEPAATAAPASAPTSATAGPPAEGIPPVVPLPLAPHMSEVDTKAWQADKNLLPLPRGHQTLGHIEFVMDGVIQLQGQLAQENKKTFRKQVFLPLTVTNMTGARTETVCLGTNVGSLHLLGASYHSGDADSTIAEIVWHYADNSSRRTPVKLHNHLRGLTRDPYESPAALSFPFSKVVWSAPHPTGAGRHLRLYRVTYANPQPAKTVRRLELFSPMAQASLFVLGLTLDPLAPGQRPDDSPNLEPTDPLPPNLINLLVVSPNNEPVAGGRFRIQIYQREGNDPRNISRWLLSDGNGGAPLAYPPVQNLDRLEVSVGHEDYGGRKITWSPRTGEVIPAAYTFKLGEGIAIGGIVVDEADVPVYDVKLSLYRFWSGGDEMNAPGEQPDFPSRTTTTDARGNWQVKGLPPKLLDRIGLRLNHPDFVETNFTVVSYAGVEAQLRNGTHKMVLRRGSGVRGRVIDEFDRPIEGARVWAGMMNYSGTQDTKTDAQGAFSFRNLREGELQFSVLAKGHKPEVRKVTVKEGMEEIVFKLSPGAIIRGIVKNESGEGIPGVRIALESPSGGVSQEYQFEMTSGQDGRFEWDGAPDEPKNFCFLKTGYEVKRRQTLRPEEENVVTLRKSRKVQGWVLDAETGKPITRFRAGIGRSYGSEQFYADYPGMKDYTNPNGTFEGELNEEQNNAVKAEADDYAEKIETLPKAENGVVQVVLRLKPSAALRGVLVNSQGAPVAGATVALTTGNPMGSSVRLQNGRLTTYERGRKIVATEANGSFVLPSPPENGGMVVASAESGFASAPAEQVRSSGRLVLQDFGRIEGAIQIAGAPAAGQEFLFSLQNLGVSPDWESARTVSDEQGYFHFDKVPAGEGSVIRLIKSGERSWTHSHNTRVLVEPGKTTQVRFGGSGATLQGRILLESPPTEGERLSFSAHLSTKMSEVGRSFSTPEEARAFYSSPEWKERSKQMKSFGVSIGADGSLSADSIPPGEYTLRVSASKAGSQPWEQQPVASGTATVVVPENASPNAPLRLDTVILKPVKR